MFARPSVERSQSFSSDGLRPDFGFLARLWPNHCFWRAQHFTQFPTGSLEFAMRSDQIHLALARGINRFEVPQLVLKGVRVTHISGSRFEDSINNVLQYPGAHETERAWLHPIVFPGTD
jgi:hypothetical protein